jgi:hypothetical protein
MNVAKVCKASKPYPSPIRKGKCVLFCLLSDQLALSLRGTEWLDWVNSGGSIAVPRTAGSGALQPMADEAAYE